MTNAEKIRARFDRYVEKDADGCWTWSGPKSHNGYGRLSLSRESGKPHRRIAAHRYAYMIFVGQIPEGFQLDHLCRNRGCVNPAHLDAVTAQENVHRSTAVAGINSRKTHCHAGHPFDEINTYIGRRAGRAPTRECRACRSARQKR